MRGKCERGQGSANADGAGAEAFAGDGYSQKASFGPMAAISRRGQGGRIYNNTRARVLLRRMCVKPAALTTHSPLKISARPRTATRPPRALPLPHAAPTHARRLRDARPPTAQPIPRRRPSLAPVQRHALPEHFRSPPQPRRTPADCAIHSPQTAQPIPRRRPCSPPHSDTPFPSTSAPPRSPDACPQAVRCIPRSPHNSLPAEDLLPPQHSDTPFPCPPATSPQRRRTPADLTTHSPPKACSRPRSASLPPLPFRFGHKKRHRTVDVRCRMSRSTVVAVGHWGW